MVPFENDPPQSQTNERYKMARPVGSGKYGEPTTPVRIPTSLLADFKIWLAEKIIQKK